MEKITIRYSISRTVALVEGRNEFGTAEYQPTDTELAFLSVDERKWLDTLDLKHYTSVFALPSGAPPVWPTIAEAIKASRQAALDKQAAELTEREARITEALAAPDEKWFSERSDWRYSVKNVYVTIPSYCSHYGWMQQDPRILARIDSLKPELERRQAVANEANEQRKAEREAAEQRKAQELAVAATAKQEAVENLTDWCEFNGPDHLKRAAKEDYDVVGGCVQWLTEQLRAQYSDPVHCTILRDNTKLWDRYDWSERKSPGPKAFEVLDAVNVAVAELAHPTSVTIEVERILLVEVEPPEDECDDPKREFTAVVVNITHPAAARRCLVIEVKG
jgi:hypothetical protein